jgi:tRNA 2-selenouridine synthase
MTRPITIDAYFKLPEVVPLIDVRTPAEFEQGHVPGAFNIPLFTNEERVLVGTKYKQVGREEAILLGFDLTGSKWSGFIKRALEISPQKKVAVHCWRGGMRSGAMAWALSLYGFDVCVIEGGYKRYRNWVLQRFESPWRLTVLGGMTGSGKTVVLKELKGLNEQVIDLEDLAQHQGSSYGTMNNLIQPTQEQFENNLAGELNTCDAEKRIWVEDESVTIGKRVIPKSFWEQMRAAILICLNVPLEKRIGKLVGEYGVLDKDFLIECTTRIKKRLGPEQTRDAVQAITDGRMSEFIRLLLVYYDKNYRKGLDSRSDGQVFFLDLENTEGPENADKIKTFAEGILAADKI